MAATRLRRTFQYPSESDDEDAVEQGMDEQDQETLISTLSKNDTSSTRIYTLLLLLFPLAPALFHIPLLITSFPSFAQNILAITSLLASAYTLYFLPLPPLKVGVINTAELKSAAAKGRGRKIGGYGLNVPGQENTFGDFERPAVPFVSDDIADPLAKYIVLGNGVLCALLAVIELSQGRTWAEGVGIGGGYLPGLVYSVILWARRELRVMDLGELEKLKYRSKAI